MSKRIICILLALVLIFAAAACGKTKQNTEASAASVNSAEGANGEGSQGHAGADPAGTATAGPDSTDAPETGKTVEELIEEKNNPDAVIESNGTSYGLKKGLKSYLFLGQDPSGLSDVLDLYVMDDANSQYSVLRINRDTVVKVDILNEYGTVVSSTTQQISFASGYSRNTKANCENAVRAVSNMLGGINVDGYVALNYEAIIPMNDAIGGVEVTIEDDFSEVDPTLVMGETVLLLGEHAHNYIRGRTNVGDGSNQGRMKRQQTFLSAFTKKVRGEVNSGHSGIVNDLYNAASPYITSNMASGSITNLALKYLSYGQKMSRTISGTASEVTYKTGKTNVEYVLDSADLDKAILEIFYTELD